MRNLRRLGTLMMVFTMIFILSACNKNDDELVLITTEAVEKTTEVATTEEVTTETVKTTEELTDKEKNITYKDLYDANKGDILLAGGLSYGMNTTYYALGEESFTEYHFLGFDSQGIYSQVYENSDGYIEILDGANSYWYVMEEDELSILIYPEPLVAAAIIDSNHNSMMFDFSAGEDSTEIVQEVYKIDGKLKVETVYGDTAGVNYLMEYTLDDSWKVEEIFCYSMDGEKLAYSTVATADTYEVPSQVKNAMAMEQGYRTITIKYVDEETLDMMYYTPVDVPIKLSMVEYGAYSDEGCTQEWVELEVDENGVYKDVTIFMKKNTKEGE